eukprot:CAMPEP_0203681346 /NCGR_PEP_ID=MMETSP0090-20130426/42457_1 /ASSEMBLY_ACC=CAM_ASM_001088 /TAXON_ID=426623 /ORGANISM="Chaetoceros affinis, Strain CCMP159" /LENGTH=749 /DNA_ID=CAMNT_0050549797 /DNA_START=8 /DNA_END=2254 /DNA_ORIENTATION=-
MNHKKQTQSELEAQPETDLLSKMPSFQKLSERTRSISFKGLSLMKRNSTFWPTTEELLAKHPSLEFLNPEFYSSTRKSSPISAIFNLVATVCGGGVLTLPIAFSRAGIIPSTVLMIFSAIITDFAMYILCSCARRTGGRSYGDVARLAFGAKAEFFVTVFLFVFLCFVIIAYFVLVKDIWTPVLMHTFPALEQWCRVRWNLDPETSNIPSDIFLIGFIIVSLPLLLKKDLHALRHTCYVGFASLIILVAAIVRRTFELNFVTDVGIFHRNVKWWQKDINDIIYAFPIISLSFFSIYNVLTVHSALINPTRERMKFVLDGTIVLCFVLFYTVGLCGYLYAYEDTLDNILLNFPIDCPIVFIGRIGYGFTLMFGLPLVFLPCREALLAIPILLKQWMGEEEPCTQALTPCDCESFVTHSCAKETNGCVEEGKLIINGINFNEEKPFLARKREAISDGTSSVSPAIAPSEAFETVKENCILPKTNSKESIFQGETHCEANFEASDIISDEEKPLLAVDVDNNDLEEVSSNNDTTVSNPMNYGSTSRGNDAFSISQDGTNDYQGHLKVTSVHFDEEESIIIDSESIRYQRELRTIIVPSQELSSKNFVTEVSKSCDSSIDHKSTSSDEKFFDAVSEGDDLYQSSKVRIESSSSGTKSALIKKSEEEEKEVEEITEEFSENHRTTFVDAVVHLMSTMFLVTGGYIFAVAVPGVGIVWSICGSSMALIIGFFIPSACYLKIRSRKQLNPRSLGAW